MDKVCCIRVRISGKVQGVGFRFWTVERANMLGLTGWVRNCLDGTVEACFKGAQTLVKTMIEDCYEGPSEAFVTHIETFERTDEAPEIDDSVAFQIYSTY